MWLNSSTLAIVLDRLNFAHFTFENILFWCFRDNFLRKVKLGLSILIGWKFLSSQWDCLKRLQHKLTFRLRLPSRGPGFESQASHRRFLQFIFLKLKLYLSLILQWEEDENKLKWDRDWPIKKFLYRVGPFRPCTHNFSLKGSKQRF